jgi:hypothetical protein
MHKAGLFIRYHLLRLSDATVQSGQCVGHRKGFTLVMRTGVAPSSQFSKVPMVGAFPNLEDHPVHLNTCSLALLLTSMRGCNEKPEGLVYV